MMNRQNLIGIVLMVLLPMVCFGQTSVMDQIKSTVAEKYPGFTVDETEKESWCNGETLLEVEIEKGEEDNEEEMTLLFSSDGKIRYHEVSIDPSQLPQVVVDAFRKACSDCGDPREADKLTALDGGDTVFEVEGRKGLREYSLIFLENGQMLCRL